MNIFSKCSIQANSSHWSYSYERRHTFMLVPCGEIKFFHSPVIASLSSSFRFHILNLVNPSCTLWTTSPVPLSVLCVLECRPDRRSGKVTLCEEETVVSSVLERALEELQRIQSAGSESHLCFSWTAVPPQATSNEHCCSIAPSQLKRRLRIARAALPTHPPTTTPLPQPIHHTQNASHWPSSSPAGRRKIDLFVYRGKESARERGGAKGKDSDGSRGRLIPRCVFVSGCVWQRLTLAVSQMSR